MYQKQVSLIVYMSNAICNDKIWHFIRTQSWHGQVEIYYTLNRFYQRFTQPGCSNTVIVLLIADRRELENIVQYAELFSDQNIILVLPNRAKETVTMGHALYPRYVSYADSDLKDVTSVLHKLIGRRETCPAAMEIMQP